MGDKAERMRLNPEPLRAVKVSRCTGCGKRAPWCSCGKADYVERVIAADQEGTDG
jgi:hypothetical protein